MSDYPPPPHSAHDVDLQHDSSQVPASPGAPPTSRWTPEKQFRDQLQPPSSGGSLRPPGSARQLRSPSPHVPAAAATRALSGFDALNPFDPAGGAVGTVDIRTLADRGSIHSSDQTDRGFDEDDEPPVAIIDMPIVDFAVVAPFSQKALGANVALSVDGYTVTRTTGTRQSAAIGDSPLQRQAHGLYFEVELVLTLDGWMGGLGIGVTHMPPQRLNRMPDKAWQIPGTFILGYRGCAFLDGKERTSPWCADSLPVGARVGLLITAEGMDLFLFVDGEPVVHIPGSVLADARIQDRPLYPIVDVFAATQGVTLQAHGGPPPPPWSVAAPMPLATASLRPEVGALATAAAVMPY